MQKHKGFMKYIDISTIKCYHLSINRIAALSLREVETNQTRYLPGKGELLY